MVSPIRRKLTLGSIAAAGSAVAAATLPGAAWAAYPDRPITIIVPWGAGGGTDAVARIIASLLEKDLGRPVNVVNRTGGSGVVGHSAIANAAPDGYTLGLITVEITMMHHQKLTELNPASYTPIALVNLDPAGFQVRADSPYKTLKDAVEAIKANPGKFKASGTGQGGIWHLALAGMLRDLKIDPAAVPWVPSNGAAPGLQDLVAGGIEFVPCSLPEARSLIDAGRVRSLAVMAEQRASLFPDVPTLKEAIGSNWATGAWRGIAAPKGLPEDIRKRLETAVQKVYNSAEYKDFMTQRGFGMIWGNSQEFAKFMAKGDADMKAVMTAVGLAK
ncbi:MAG TPA: tripartite tricarboxylate transporter substrate binding protein [Burkholderiaceae bacterium]|nr:tripartite tricarboxylate transporter substrate binding protein [Burkholderiaceae bacterium]